MSSKANFTEQEIIDTLSELVKIHSPYFEEEEILNYMYQWLNKRNLNASYHTYEDNKVTGFKGKNVIGNLKGGNNGPKVLLNGHLDTVKICDGWTKDPLTPTIEGNKMYGLGSVDMKAGVTSIMLAIDKFNKKYKNFNGEIVYQFVSDEEGPYGLGTNYLIEDGLCENMDVAIIPEPSGCFVGIGGSCVCLGARGAYSYKVILKGKAAHAANPEDGKSAIVDASKLIAELKQTKFTVDKKLGKGSICILEISGGGNACSVADRAEFTVFRHIVRDENKETLKNEVHEAAKRANIKCEYEIEFREAPTEGSEGFKPYIVDENNAFVKTFIDVLEQTTNEKPSIEYFPSIGDFNYVGSRLKIPTIVYGASGGNYHSKDEYVEIDSVVESTEAIYNYLVKLLT